MMATLTQVVLRQPGLYTSTNPQIDTARVNNGTGRRSGGFAWDKDGAT